MVAQHLQGSTGMCLATGVKLSPAVKTTGDPGSDLRIDGIQLARLLGKKAVAAAIGGMKMHVVAAESAQQRVDLVRVAQVECGMFG